MSEIPIRRAERADLPALRDIYNHYAVHTPVNFDIEPRTLAEREAWFGQFASSGRYQCFVAEEGGRVIGYAGSTRFKEKEAYRTTIEMTIYCAPDRGRQGLGGRLYTRLFDALEGEDIHRAYAGVTLPNEASVRIHERFGFRRVGTYAQVGRKFGQYWDVGLFLKDMD
ncbi:MAG: N-acetyltransferase [Proteobacteria bacterium]|nr:N-acetyltransferase [Pseudomonadota bacterium]